MAGSGRGDALHRRTRGDRVPDAVAGALCLRLLWFDDDHGQWVQDCEEAEDTIRSLTETAWETYDARVTGRLFEGAPQPANVPPRAGYWLGDREVQAALLKTTLAELFRLTRLPPRT